ncbi:ATP-binding protein [Paraburkholderia sp. SIMBA_053]|uniref:ATP-binding protein n=1 Tax=Paraburkholderia sp. SIMBA_053 TaxID=3085794 RepID=UPI00397939E7
MSTPASERPRKTSARKAADDMQSSEKEASESARSPFDGASTEAIPEAVPSWSIARREEILTDHPVSRGQYTIPTPMLINVHEEARERVGARRTGIVFTGETRAGKTTCATSIKDYLAEEFNKIYVVMASARHSLRPKQGLMSRLILEGSGHVLAARRDPEALLRNVILDVMTNVSNLGGDQFVLILDEVNLCNESDFGELLEIHNILCMKGITMTTISFGQPEILHLISALALSNQRQIIARFFRKPIQFQCCNSKQTLTRILQSLDEETEWPEGSGWSYTYFFFPEAFEAGFRIQNYGTAIWNALVNAAPGNKGGFTMESIVLTINGLYLGKKDEDSKTMVLSEEDIVQAIALADL